MDNKTCKKCNHYPVCKIISSINKYPESGGIDDINIFLKLCNAAYKAVASECEYYDGE